MAKYSFRLDDIAPNMNHQNFNKIMKIFDRFGVKVILGVIPDNKDYELLKYPKISDNDFWNKIKKYDSDGHEIAIHGFNHVYETKSSGILEINSRSEFAGVSAKRQKQKIAKARAVFKKYNIKPKIFMAPAHSFDETTLEVLKLFEINEITDGFYFRPYIYKGLKFYPQLVAKPRKMMFGYHTFCLHPNTMTDENIEHLERFLYEQQKNLISFSELRDVQPSRFLHVIPGYFMKKFFKYVRQIKRSRY